MANLVSDDVGCSVSEPAVSLKNYASPENNTFVSVGTKTDHVDWEISSDNETHYCFRKTINLEKAQLFEASTIVSFIATAKQLFTRRCGVRDGLPTCGTWQMGWYTAVGRVDPFS